MRTVKTCSNAFKVYLQQSEARKITKKIEQTIILKISKSYSVKPVYSNHPWDLEKVAVWKGAW